MSRSQYQTMALLSASAGIVKHLIDHPQFVELQPTILWTMDQIQEAVSLWPVARDGAPLVAWVHGALKRWEDSLEDIPLPTAIQMAEQMMSDLAGRLRDRQKLTLLSGAHEGILGLSRQIDPDGNYEECRRASELLSGFYKDIEFVP